MRLLCSILFFMATLLIYLGVSLLGWGLGDLGGFFSSTPRLGYAIVVGLFSLEVGIQACPSTAGIRGGKGEESKFVFRQKIVCIVLVLALYGALFLIPFLDRRGIGVFSDGSFVRWVGVGLSALGFVLVYVSGVVLGKQYSADVTIQAGHHLITNNIYRSIRHPRYLGVIIFSIGVSCVFRSWIVLLSSVFLLGIILYRIIDEEILIHKEFGTDREAYCKRSWRLAPYIY